MDYISSRLSRDEIFSYLGELPAILTRLGLHECKVMYGWDCDLPMDDLWQDHYLKVTDLSAFIASAIERGIFRPGESDLIIQAYDESLSIRACHESDVHLASTSDSVLIALAAPIATRHPDFRFKSEGSWQVRRFTGVV